MTTTLPPALILAAGLGTRLRPLSDQRAKPAMPVAGVPVIRRLVTALVAQGVQEVVINLHHRPETIAGIVGDGAGLGCRIRYSWERVVLGSAGGPRHALPLLGDRFLLINGDTICDVDLSALVAAHHDRGAAVTLAVTSNPAPDRYGGLLVDDDHWVRTVCGPGDPRGPLHFVGAQVAEARVFEPLTDGVPAASIGGLYDRLWARAGQVGAHQVTARFHEVGTPADYLETSRSIGATEGAPDTPRGPGCVVHPTARVTGSILWDEVEIGADCVVTESILGDGVRLAPGTRLDRVAVVKRSAVTSDGGDAKVLGDLLVAELEPATRRS